MGFSLLEKVGIATSGLDALDFSLGQGFHMAVHGVLERIGSGQRLCIGEERGGG